MDEQEIGKHKNNYYKFYELILLLDAYPQTSAQEGDGQCRPCVRDAVRGVSPILLDAVCV